MDDEIMSALIAEYEDTLNNEKPNQRKLRSLEKKMVARIEATLDEAFAEYL